MSSVAWYQPGSSRCPSCRALLSGFGGFADFVDGCMRCQFQKIIREMSAPFRASAATWFLGRTASSSGDSLPRRSDLDSGVAENACQSKPDH